MEGFGCAHSMSWTRSTWISDTFEGLDTARRLTADMIAFGDVQVIYIKRHCAESHNLDRGP
jgi:hypothetical protein